MMRRARLGTGPRDRRGVTFQGRFLAVVLLVVVCFGTLVGRLGQVQLVGHSDFAAASSLDTRTLTEPAMRGRILDARGLPLADNRTSTVVTIERRVIVGSADRAGSVVREVARVLGLAPEPLLARTWLCGEEEAPAAPACWVGSPQAPVPLAEDVDPTRALTLVERPDRFPGIAVESRPVRTYPRPLGTSAAQLIGYLGPVRADEVGPGTGLAADDLVGRAGLEEQYDEVLRGTPGRTVVSVDPRGLVTGVLSRTPPVDGRDLVTSVDARVQAAAEQALAEQIAAARARGWAADSGAVVVLDPNTGAVAALASAPTYDPNVWTGGISAADYATLTDPAAGTPLLSRPIGVQLAPASTLKPASVTAAVAAGNPLRGTYDCPSSYRIGNRVFNNHETKGRGLISFAKAIQISCDTVFYKAAHDAWRAQGGLSASTDAPDPFATVARGFGLGSRTGIDLPGEAAGRIPDRASKKASWEATKDELCSRARSGLPRGRRRRARRLPQGGRRRELRRRLPRASRRRRELLHRPGRCRDDTAPGGRDVRVDRQRRHGGDPARGLGNGRPAHRRRGRGRARAHAPGPDVRRAGHLPAGRAALGRHRRQHALPVPDDDELAGRRQDGHR